MALIGSTLRSILMIGLVLAAFSSCKEQQRKSSSTQSGGVFAVTRNDIPALMSGVWYHTRKEKPAQAVERTYSWGKTTIGYWNALVIDLLNGNQLIEREYGGGDRVTYDIDAIDPNQIHVFVGLSTGGGEKASIEIISREEIIFKFENSGGAYYKRANGMYYKAFDPGR